MSPMTALCCLLVRGHQRDPSGIVSSHSLHVVEQRGFSGDLKQYFCIFSSEDNKPMEWF